MRFGLGFGLHPANPGWGYGACVFVCALRLYPAIRGWGVRCGCVCLGLGVGCAPPFLARGSGLCFFVCATSEPRQSWLGCALRVGVLWLRTRLRPPIPGWGCVFWCVRFACTLSILPGCAVWVCVLGLGKRLRRAIPGCCFWGGCVRVRAPTVPCHSWLGCAVWACVLGFLFQLRPATHGSDVGLFFLVPALGLYAGNPRWGVRVGCVCLGSCFSCTPPMLAGVSGRVFWCVRSACPLPIPARVCGVGVSAWARVSSPPPLPWLGCWGVCLCACSVLTPPLLPGVYTVNVCAWAQVSRAPTFSSWGVGLCVLVFALRLYPANPGWVVRCWCVCWASDLGCICNFWLGCWGLCVFVCALRLYPANPG